jgi:hypothetical protein
MSETVTRKAKLVHEQRSCEQEMSSALEMASMVQEAADAARTSNWKDRVHAAARILGLPFARAKALYYGEYRRLTAEEMDLARLRIQQHREDRLHETHQQHLAWLYDTVAHLHEAGEDVAGFDVGRLERAVARLGADHRALGYQPEDEDQSREWGGADPTDFSD